MSSDHNYYRKWHFFENFGDIWHPDEEAVAFDF